MPPFVRAVVQLSLILIVVGVGLQARWQGLIYALRRPAMLARSFIAINIIVPAAAVVLCLIFPVAPLTKAGLIIIAVSPLAPLVPGKMVMSGADQATAFGLYVVLILAAIVVVPATVAIIDEFVTAEVSLPVSAVALLVLKSVLIPLVVGLVIGTRWPAFAQRAARICTIAAYVVVLPVLAVVIAKVGGALLHLLGDGTLAVIVLTIAAGLAAGHFLGGPLPQNRAALAQAAVTRHPGIAALIATRNFESPQVMLAIMLFFLTSIVIGIAHAVVQKRLAPSKGSTGENPT
jgi:BASS family bile acid:Na+ symporter